MSGIYLGPEKRYPPSLRLKRTLAEGKLPQGTVLVIQDFTQVDLESGFVQDLIVCIYSHDESMVQRLFLQAGKGCLSLISFLMPPLSTSGVMAVPEKTISYNFFCFLPWPQRMRRSIVMS